LLEKYGLTPRDQSACQSDGRSLQELHQSYSWPELMTHMVERYPGYVDDFRALEQMAPIEDLTALNVLTDHEVAVINFAEKELAGDPDSMAPLLKYLQ
jgi:dimethylamine/trimethylamine dehydrogenase